MAGEGSAPILGAGDGQRDFWHQPWWPQLTTRFSDQAAKEAAPESRILNHSALLKSTMEDAG